MKGLDAMAARFIPSGVGCTEAVEIARDMGCRIDQAADGGEIRLSHALIGRAVKIDPNTLSVGRPAVSFLREVAALRATPKAG